MIPKNVQMPNPNPKYKPPGTAGGGRGGNLMEIEKLIKHMREEAQDYRDGRTLGRAFADAEDVLDEAATALERLQAENDRLQAELEKEEAARKKQADILYELRGQKYEQTTAIDQLRAENDRFRRERDAAVGDLEIIMAYGGGNLDTCQFCKNSQCYARGGTNLCLPEWRG